MKTLKLSCYVRVTKTWNESGFATNTVKALILAIYVYRRYCSITYGTTTGLRRTPLQNGLNDGNALELLGLRV